MDWSDLRHFLALARGGTLRAAAERAETSHATVDRRIRALEAGMGVRLFQRTPGGFLLSTAGKALLPKAERVEEAVLAAQRSVEALDRTPSGRVHLTLPSWIAYPVLAPMVRRFCDAYPDVDLQVTVTNAFQRLGRAEADVSLRVATEVSEDVLGRRLFRWDDAVIASHEYLAQHWASRGPGGEGLHWLGWTGPRPLGPWPDLFPAARTVHAIRDEMLFAHLLRHGHGMGIFPYAFVHLYPELTVVPGTPVLPDRSLWLLLHPDLRDTPRVRVLVDFLAREIGAMEALFRRTESAP